jgi:transcriptional regulator with XRE-family HTH domain
MNERTSSRLERDDSQAAIGRTIRELRGPMPQSELAATIGMGQPALSAWEAGKVDLTLDQVASVEDALGSPRGVIASSVGYVDLDALWTRAELGVRRVPTLEGALRAARAAHELGLQFRLWSTSTANGPEWIVVLRGGGVGGP